MRNLLLIVIICLSLNTESYSADTNTQKPHFQNANNYTVKIRSRVEYPFLKEERGSFSGAGFLAENGPVRMFFKSRYGSL